MLSQIFTFISKLLYPNGRAFSFPNGSNMELLHKALGNSEERVWKDAISIKDCLLPDNPNFTEVDATQWERRLGMISATGVALEDRKRAILLKYNYPVTDAPRQSSKYLEIQLRAAGFNVRVYENNFGGVTKTPEEWLSPVGATLHSASTRHGPLTSHSDLSFIGAFHSLTVRHGPDLRHGMRFNNIVANHIEADKDALFAFGGEYRRTFYIAGEEMPHFTQVPAAREKEFREMILRLKPTNTVGFLFVQYI